MTTPRELKVDVYTRAPKEVIRLTLGGSHQDPPEVAIEVTGHARREWARKIKAADAINEATKNLIDWVEACDLDSTTYVAHAWQKAVAALALLDPPTTTEEEQP